MLMKITYFCGIGMRGKRDICVFCTKMYKVVGALLTFNKINIYLLPGKRVATVSTTTTLW
jgi:hypothetical protein